MVLLLMELPKLQRETSGSKVTNKNTKEADLYFDKTSAQISNLVYRPGSVNIHDVAI